MTPEAFKLKLDEYPIEVEFWEHGKASETPKKVADRISIERGYKSLGEKWVNLDWEYRLYPSQDRGDPNVPLAELIQGKMMAYSEAWFSANEAYRLAETFYGLFSKRQLVRLTNRTGNGWNPITDFTFEAVHFAMDENMIGLIMVVDED